ncbi:threonine-phosphate decarboxylase [Cytobacillus eiseniae]|uniref:threonine-phosphate decarboxylase n=1 Tax=Cytobacillus eiseniae TaxID=762947 RepID=A0ABS4RHQ5_9BACI|nr:threonine-phosphate decarboxylase CobD [Cytobacillus eiseniae]MBP2242416.1 threonine-phosphate decarboxylase [Cytobacillus eiseniae]
MKWPVHGSNPQYLYEAMEITMPDTKVDFSANINPLGPPPLLKKNWHQLMDVVSDYPDPKGDLLKQKLAEREGIHKNQILIGNGGSELISLLGRMLAGKNVLIVQPAFSEYEEVCRMNGCEIDYHQLESNSWEWDDDGFLAKLQKADVLFFCNPSNPTGIFYSKTRVLHLIKECERTNCLFIMDEAFYDFLLNYESIVPYIEKNPHLIILRSMTKMFAIPGLRLGYIMAHPLIIEQLSTLQPHWSINALALKAGEWCLESGTYINETRELIQTERERLFAFYKEWHFEVSPSKINFYLLKDLSLKDQLPLFQFLIEGGIIPRHTMNFPGLEGEWLRFAVKGPDANDQLMEALMEWRKNNRLSSL